MPLLRDEPLARHTSFRLGGAARSFTECTTEAELIAEVTAANHDALILGGGSNVLVADGVIDRPVIAVRTRGVAVDVDACAGAWVTVAAGETWDALVERAVGEGWCGIEALSGIPGLVGATPIQNVGAYGQEVASTVARVRAFDRLTKSVITIAGPDCGFDYRWSMFKAEPGRYVVLDVAFQFKLGDRSEPVRYAELARALGVAEGERAPLSEVRSAVLELRGSKGMVLDDNDHDSWSAGSFFLNPVVENGFPLPDGAVTFPQTDGRTKVSAAWLIGAAGFERGFALEGSAAGISTKHTLALTNRGGASAADVLALARVVRDGVSQRFGITLEPEPMLIDCAL